MAKNDKLDFKKNVRIKNKRASFEYSFEKKYQAGIVLKGTEIKSIRLGKVNMQDAFCIFIGGELWVRELNISPYSMAGFANHLSKADRKLLMKKKELKNLEKDAQNVGLTIIPTQLYINDRGIAKIEIALAKGKKLYDKRQTLKEKELKREIIKF